MRTYLVLLLFSAGFSYFLTLSLARLAAERGWAGRHGDEPDADGTPRLGGVAVFIAFLLTLGILFLRHNQVTSRVTQESLRGLALLGAATGVFLLGLYDDLRGARPWEKLLVQLLAGGWLYMADFRVEILSNPFTHTPIVLGWLSVPVTLLWLVAISNAFNLIDGLDGLAAGVGLFACLALFLLAALVGNSFTAVSAICLAGALLGFLPHNFHPARIYLGDSGSLTLGLCLAALSVASSQKGPVLITMAVPLLIFGLPLLEVSVTTLRRLLSGHPLFRRDEEHLHHRLLKIGGTQRSAVLVLYGLAALFALSSLLVFNYTGAFSPVIALLCGTLAWLVVSRMQYPEFAELDSHIRQALRNQPQVLRNQISIRKAGALIGATATADELWCSVTDLLEQLDFGGARCEFHGSRSLHFNWGNAAQQEGGNTLSSQWMMEIPLVHRGIGRGTLVLYRSLERSTMLFRLSALMDLLRGSFCNRMTDFADHETLPLDDEAGVVPSVRKAAAG
ncbi:MAG: undecaprenyl/decaprenyl-phosphate alpha-N-acetylglucosaminyl 1-phosphate transferase [Acidipila sp.]|nr:undecaprenyl/decaprenyl-phosphate alpha-N-acetylglucosaminyl 1-phosphate transferase [Acidipila sp.]